MSDTAFILILENDPAHAEVVASGLRAEGHLCLVVDSPAEALDSLRSRQPDVLVIQETQLTDESGQGLFAESRRLAPDSEVVLLSARSAGGKALRSEATRGSRVFQSLGLGVSVEEIVQTVGKAAEQAKRNRAARALKEQAERRFEFEGLVTGNPQMLRIITTIRKLAPSKLTVLILGESGTGKELVAKAIHLHSQRAQRPYHAVNCAGLNENLLESELFGHVRGSFTGAIVDRKGLFEVVDGGTLFLDEVGDMPLSMQAKLLRVLEVGEIIPVGSTEIRKVDVRVIAATRRDIREMIEKSEFRDDLYYRLNYATIRVPPLRERRDDIPLLIEHFLSDAVGVHDKPIEGIAPDVIRKLSGYQWPGNVRELRSVIDQMVVLSDGPVIGLEDLPEHIRGSTEIVLAGMPNTAGLTMEQMEKAHIANTLKLNAGNREKTSKMLGIGARTLYRKLRDYGLQ